MFVKGFEVHVADTCYPKSYVATAQSPGMSIANNALHAYSTYCVSVAYSIVGFVHCPEVHTVSLRWEGTHHLTNSK